jgi:hypothetical protein
LDGDDGNVLHDIVAKLIEEKRRSICPEILGNERDFLGSLHTFNYLLGSPSTVLVNADHGKVRGDVLEHREPRSGRTSFKKLLYDLDNQQLQWSFHV